LGRWQDVQVIDPTFSKSDKADKLGTFEAAPHLARLENALSEEPPILLRGMQDRNPWQSAVTGATLNNSCCIHVVKGQALQHAILGSDWHRSQYPNSASMSLVVHAGEQCGNCATNAGKFFKSQPLGLYSGIV
jgi:hypothetical protein